MPSTIPVVEDKSLKTQYQVSFVPVEAMDVDPTPAAVTSPVMKNRTTSFANAESSPSQILDTLQSVCRGARLCTRQPGGRGRQPAVRGRVCLLFDVLSLEAAAVGGCVQLAGAGPISVH